MSIRGEGRVGARLAVCAAAAAVLAAPAMAQGQPVDPAALDPSAPLDAMPDLGVAWPELDAEPVVSPELTDDSSTTAADAPVAIDEASSERRYAVVLSGIEGVAGDGLVAAFDAQSALAEGRKRTANAAQIDRRARADAELLAELLRSRGYYDATVEPEIAVAGGGVNVTLAATPGRLYRFDQVALPGLEAAGEEAAGLREAFAVKPGEPVVAADVIAAGIALKVALGERGFAGASVGEQDIIVDHEAGTAQLTLPVRPGEIARFGQIRVTGSPPFPAAHVQRIARFDAGDRYRRSRVDDLRRALVATGLVASAEVTVVPLADGRTVDLAVKLQPAPPRTIAGELGYGTGEGIRAEASWQHRNFFNPEGALTVRGVAGTQEQLASVSVRRANYRRRDQTLTAQIAASHVDRVAYGAKTFLLSGGIERQSNFIWQKKWTWSLGAELIATDERDTIASTGEERRRTFFIAALPTSLMYDGSDDLLDPTRGFRLGGRLSPEASLQSGAFGYAKAQIDASAYRPVSERVVAAGRVRVGSIIGAGRGDIAPSRRFYAGGGGSVRGYGYQRLGPRDAFGDPIGGKSLMEFSLEARVRLASFGGNFGVVPFLDGGSLGTGSTPRFRDWQLGAGLGLRYYSSFGPIRIDVGTPLNRRERDGRVAVTVSLGQAF